MYTTRKWGAIAAGALAALGMSERAHASLIGDEIDIRFFLPNSSGFDQTVSTVVTADDSDAVVITNGSSINFEIDPFENGFVITRLSGILVNIGAGSFFRFSDLDLTPDMIVTDASLTQNWLFFRGETSFTADSVSVDFTGNSLAREGDVMTVTFETMVPAPGAAALLGLAGIAATRRRR